MTESQKENIFFAPVTSQQGNRYTEKKNKRKRKENRISKDNQGWLGSEGVALVAVSSTDEESETRLTIGMAKWALKRVAEMATNTVRWAAKAALTSQRREATLACRAAIRAA